MHKHEVYFHISQALTLCDVIFLFYNDLETRPKERPFFYTQPTEGCAVPSLQLCIVLFCSVTHSLHSGVQHWLPLAVQSHKHVQPHQLGCQHDTARICC